MGDEPTTPLEAQMEAKLAASVAAEREATRQNKIARDNLLSAAHDALVLYAPQPGFEFEVRKTGWSLSRGDKRPEVVTRFKVVRTEIRHYYGNISFKLTVQQQLADGSWGKVKDCPYLHDQPAEFQTLAAFGKALGAARRANPEPRDEAEEG
jgi:hypothetical protein